MATEMELRVATAIADSIGGAPQVWLHSAKAAIKAMREPSAEMHNVIEADRMFGDGDSVETYQAMIFAASPDETP